MLENYLDDIADFDKTDGVSTCGLAVRYLCQKADVGLSVLEIGTAYGKQLNSFTPLCKNVVSIDCMYDWVPDIKPDEQFDHKLVDQGKVDQWKKYASGNCELVIGSSYEVYKQEEYKEILESKFDVIIIDGCHSPKEAVASDYYNYCMFMNNPHYIIADDMQQSTCKEGAEMIKQRILDTGLNYADSEIVFRNIKTRVAYVWL